MRDMDPDEAWYIDRLRKRDVSESDKSSCLDMLELLESKAGLPAIVSIIADSREPLALRERAASAVRIIGPEDAKPCLLTLIREGDPETRRLAEIALIFSPD